MKKRGFEMGFSMLVYWLIAIIVLALAVFLVFTLKSKGMSALDFFRNLWRFG
jgi:hypothetical protein